MPAPLRLLLISSQFEVIEQLQVFLQPAGIAADIIHSPDSIEDEYLGTMDICIVDTQVDAAAALGLVQRLRAVQPTLYIGCLVPQEEKSIRLLAYERGADHVFNLPIEPLEISAAMSCYARPGTTAIQLQTEKIPTEGIALLNQTQSVRGSISEQALTHSEFLLLLGLGRAKGHQLELWQIYDILGKDEHSLQKAALEAQISRLRKKLKDAGAGNQALRAVRLKGYQLCCPIQII